MIDPTYAEVPAVKLADLQPEIQELGAEDAENVSGGIIAVLIGQQTQQTGLKIMPGAVGFCDGSVSNATKIVI